MKNLENLNVQVLDKNEMKKTEGGFIPLIYLAYVGGAAIVAAGFYVGYRSAEASNRH